MVHAQTNRLYLCGRVESAPVFSHACCEVRCYALTLSVLRTSGAADLLPVIAAEHLLPVHVSEGDALSVRGQLRSYSIRTETGSRLKLAAFAKLLDTQPAPDENDVQLTGTLIKPPVCRVTPLGREIADLFVSVERAFGKSDYLPVIAWGRNAARAGQWRVGDTVQLSGRLQSRRYNKCLPDGTTNEMIAYEVSASAIQRLAADGGAPYL